MPTSRNNHSRKKIDISLEYHKSTKGKRAFQIIQCGSNPKMFKFPMVIQTFISKLIILWNNKLDILDSNPDKGEKN